MIDQYSTHYKSRRIMISVNRRSRSQIVRGWRTKEGHAETYNRVCMDEEERFRLCWPFPVQCPFNLVVSPFSVFPGGSRNHSSCTKNLAMRTLQRVNRVFQGPANGSSFASTQNIANWLHSVKGKTANPTKKTHYSTRNLNIQANENLNIQLINWTFCINDFDSSSDT